MSLKRSASIFVLISVVMWILPLGSYIAKSQESIACAGKRAVHMCELELKKQEKIASAKVKLSKMQVSLDPSPGTSAGQLMYALNSESLPDLHKKQRFNVLPFPALVSQFVSSPDPVPKV